MATTITISTGPLVTTRTFQDDTAAQAALLKFYEAYNLGATDATPQQKLDAIRNWIVNSIANVSVESHIEAGRAALEDEARTIYKFE